MVREIQLNQALTRDVNILDRVRHLIKFAEKVNGKWVYRFAKHPRISYWAFNMIQRKRTLEQTGIFLKQNPSEAHLTIEELREMAENNNSSVFMSKVSRYIANIAGSNAYWHKVKEDLKAIVTNSFLLSHQLICIGLIYIPCFMIVLI